jgi:hypothetical protein
MLHSCTRHAAGSVGDCGGVGGAGSGTGSGVVGIAVEGSVAGGEGAAGSGVGSGVGSSWWLGSLVG